MLHGGRAWSAHRQGIAVLGSSETSKVVTECVEWLEGQRSPGGRLKIWSFSANACSLPCAPSPSRRTTHASLASTDWKQMRKMRGFIARSWCSFTASQLMSLGVSVLVLLPPASGHPSISPCSVYESLLVQVAVACGGQGHHVVSSCMSVSGGDVTGGDWCRRSVVVMLLGGRASSMDFRWLYMVAHGGELAHVGLWWRSTGSMVVMLPGGRSWALTQHAKHHEEGGLLEAKRF